MLDYFTHDETGAPVLNNAAGALNALLYTLLVTGFRVRTPTSITVSAGLATVVDAGHSYADGRRVRVAGAAVGAINGDKLITVTGTGSYTFAAPGVSDGVVGGTLETRRPPLGWARLLDNGAGKSIFGRTDAAATQPLLRVDHSAGGSAPGVRMIESCGADVDTFTAPTPALSVTSSWGVGPNTAAAKQWLLVGDGRTLYFFGEVSGGGSLRPPGAFGDIASYGPGDPWACLLANETSSQFSGLCYPIGIDNQLGQDSIGLARSFSGVSAGVGVRASITGPAFSSGRIFGGFGPTYPSPVDNGMVLSAPLFVAENASALGHPIRGELRGVAAPFATVALGTLHRSVVSGLVGSSRRWLLVGFGGPGTGMMAFDVDGPW